MAIFRRTANLFRRSRLDREAAAELKAHIEMRIEDNIAAGMPPAEARRDALLRFGNPEVLRERVAASDANLTLESVLRDVRFALRQLRRAPVFAATAVVILALAIGATTAIFSAVRPILFEPLPYPNAGRIVMVWDVYKSQRLETTFGTYFELNQRSRSFDVISTFEPWQPVMTGPEEPERPDGQSVTANYFHMLGVAPALGRDFVPADDVANGPRVVILADRLWRRRFAADPRIIGRVIQLDGNGYTVVGVMPRDFENVLLSTAEIWAPSQYDPAKLADTSSNAWGHHLRIAGRLRSKVGIDAARDELAQIARNPQPEFPRPRWAMLRGGLIVDSLQQDMVRGVRPALLAVLSAVALVLIIACVNVTSLLLGRGVQRQGEYAMRATLGASRGRIIRQSLTESLLLALVGGALGMAVAGAGLRVIMALIPQGLPRAYAIALNAPVFVFAFALTALVGLAAGLAPALHIPRAQLQVGLHSSSRIAGHKRQGIRRALVVSEVALALMLLIGAGLLLRSMQRLLSVDPGLSADNLLTMQVQTSGHQFDDPSPALGIHNTARPRFFDQALDEVRKVPGVTSAAFTSLLPLSDDPSWVAVYGSHFENDDPNGGHNVFRYAVSSGYFQTMHIPLLRGRYLNERDTAQAPFAALISESLARRQFPGGNAMGKRLHVGPENWPWFTVVGIAGNVRQTSLAMNDPDAVYIPEAQSWFADDTMSFVVRTRGDAPAMAPAVRQAIWSIDKNQPIVRVATMNKLLAISLAQRRFVLVLFESFSLVALILAATGIYGVLSSSVSERTREIGVRTALGASRTGILALVLRQGLTLAGIGMVLGLAGAALAGRSLAALLYGVTPLDFTTYAAVTALLLAVSALACLVPARRAAAIDPMTALRTE